MAFAAGAALWLASGPALAGTTFQDVGLSPRGTNCFNAEPNGSNIQGTWGNSASSTFTCIVSMPDGSFALVNKVPVRADAGSPTGFSVDIAAAESWADANVAGGGAIVWGDLNSRASGSQSISLGMGAQATAQNTIALGTGAAASAANSVAIGANASATTANSVALGADSTTGATTSTAGATIRGTAYTFAGGTSTGVVSVGSVGGERQLTNVAAGQLSATSTDAVNGSQLYATNQALEAITAVAGAGINVTTAQTGTGIAIGTSVANVGPGGTATATAGNNMVLTQSGTNTTFAVNDNPSFTSVTVGGTSVTASGVAIQGGPSMTTAGVNAGGKTITNVAPGVNGTDAVNVNQLNATALQVGARITGLQQEIEANRVEARRGIAAAMAMSDAPMPSAPGKTSWSAHTAFYRGEGALGASIAHRFSTQKPLAVDAGIALSSGSVGVRIGLKGEF